VTNNNLKNIRKFHGHIGPYVVLGYIMGIYVKGYLENIDRVVIYVNHKPPVSCIVDGLQLSTGCTLGKNKIKVIQSKWFQRANFFKKNKKISVTLKPILKEKIKSSARSALYYLNHSVKKSLFNLNK